MKCGFLALLVFAISILAALWLLNEAASHSEAIVVQDTRLESRAPLASAVEVRQGYHNGILAEAALAQSQAPTLRADVYTMPNYVTVADILPRVVITQYAEDLGEGYYFLANNGAGANNSLMIVNDKAQLVYYEHKPNLTVHDFKRQADGTLSYFDGSVNGFRILNRSYVNTHTWYPGNGYAAADSHDLLVLPDGHAVLMIYAQRPEDLSAYGGQANAEVVDLVIQELDQAGNVVFEWNSRDHFQYGDTYMDITAQLVDYAHGNAVEQDTDGNFLISSRHMSEITKIDRSTGDIIWRLGGKNNQFTFIGDSVLPGVGAFSFQHDIRRLPNGHITLFDNGNQFESAGLRASRGVAYELDEANKTATLVREFRTIPETFSRFMGNMQHLPNGNTVIGWGAKGTAPPFEQPVAMTEFTQEGNVALAFSFLDLPNVSYRAFKFPWQGFPASAPLLVAITDSVPSTLYYSWNGATEVYSYTVYGGETPQNLGVIAQQLKTDFEDSTSLGDVASTMCFFQVVPMTKENEAVQTSNTLYLGDDSCENGFTVDGMQTSSRSFISEQSAGNVTITLSIPPDVVTIPTTFVRTSPRVEAPRVIPEHVMSDLRFGLYAYQGEALGELANLNAPVQLAVDYAALGLTRNPSDVELLRWDETLQGWTSEGITLLQNEIVSQHLVYEIAYTGDFALFVINRAPRSVSASILIDEDQAYTLSGDDFSYFDLDQDSLAGIVIETLPDSGSLLYAGTPAFPSQVILPDGLSAMVFLPEGDQFGLPYASFTFRVSDTFTVSDPYTLTVLVRPINDLPVANDDLMTLWPVSATRSADESISTVAIPVLINDYDRDGDKLRIVSTTDPAYGTAMISGDLVVYTQTTQHDGLDTFSYTIDNGHGEQATAIITILLSPKYQYLPFLGS